MRRRDPIEVEMVTVDFSESNPPVEGSINYSACFYVFGCLLAEDVPAAAALMRPIHFIAPEGTIVNAGTPAAVDGGNVETSQRIVDGIPCVQAAGKATVVRRDGSLEPKPGKFSTRFGKGERIRIETAVTTGAKSPVLLGRG